MIQSILRPLKCGSLGKTQKSFLFSRDFPKKDVAKGTRRLQYGVECKFQILRISIDPHANKKTRTKIGPSDRSGHTTGQTEGSSAHLPLASRQCGACGAPAHVRLYKALHTGDYELPSVHARCPLDAHGSRQPKFAGVSGGGGRRAGG